MASSLLFGILNTISYTNYILMAFGLLFIHETQNDLEFRKGPAVKGKGMFVVQGQEDFLKQEMGTYSSIHD